jgi:hypothetical protein
MFSAQAAPPPPPPAQPAAATQQAPIAGVKPPALPKSTMLPIYLGLGVLLLISIGIVLFFALK